MYSMGIIGLPNAGKSTLFNALTKGKAQVASFPFCTVSPNVGMALVPDIRLEKLGRMINPEKVTPATIEFVDIAGLVRGAHRGEGLGNEFLSRIRASQALVEVVRCFKTEKVSHPEGKLNPLRDVEIIATELALSDLEIIERRLTKFQKTIKSGEKEAKEKVTLLSRFQHCLEKEILFVGDLKDEEQAFLREEGLLRVKPTVLLANISEDDLEIPSIHLEELRRYVREHKLELVEICAQLEWELAELSPEEASEFEEVLQVKESGISRLVQVAQKLLKLITFFTVTGGKEVRAWLIPEGTTALQAAGKVHSEMEKGFIKAEVISFEDLREVNSIREVRETGKVLMEGKEYRVKDGDVINFRFRS